MVGHPEQRAATLYPGVDEAPGRVAAGTVLMEGVIGRKEHGMPAGFGRFVVILWSFGVVDGWGLFAEPVDSDQSKRVMVIRQVVEVFRGEMKEFGFDWQVVFFGEIVDEARLHTWRRRPVWEDPKDASAPPQAVAFRD